MLRKEKRELFVKFSFLNKIYRLLLTLLFIYDFDFFARKLFCSLLAQSLRRKQLWKQEALNYNSVPFPVHVPTLKTEKSIIFIKIPFQLKFIATTFDLGLRTEKSAF